MMSYSSARADHARRKEEFQHGGAAVCKGSDEGIWKAGAVTRALDGVDLSLEAGGYVGIMGASGSGKTTLLNCISTIDRPTSGSIQVDGEELTGLRGRALTRFRRERLGFIFQDCNLLDTLTAFENIALSLSILRTPAAQIRDRVEETAELLGIGDCLDKYPYQMSGGQQQRCAAARAIVTRPALVLADETHRGPGLQILQAAAGAAGGAQPGSGGPPF